MLTGTLIPHGDPGDPDPKPTTPTRHVAPLFPLERRGRRHRRRAGRHRPRAGRTQRLLRARVLQAAGAERRGHAARARPARPAIRSNISPANTWTPQNLAALVERLGGAIVVTHSQSGIMGHHMTRILKERGHLDMLKGLVTLEGSCSLPNSGLNAGGLRQHPVHGAEGRLHGDEQVCQDTVERHQRPARRRSREPRRRTTSSWTRWGSSA